MAPGSAVLQRSLTVAKNGDFTYVTDGEISRAPSLYVVTKQPQTRDFKNGSVTLGTDETVRTTVDVNHVFDPTFQVRANGMWQEADVAGRDHVFDDRWGAAIAARWTPTHWEVPPVS